MKLFIVIISCLLCSSCASMRSVEMPVDLLRAEIKQGDLIKQGDWVSVGTADGEIHLFQVTDISRDKIYGDAESIANEDIVSLEIQKPTAVGYVGLGAIAVSIPIIFSAILTLVIAALL